MRMRRKRRIENMAKKKTTRRSAKTVAIKNDAWKQSFSDATMRTNFILTLSQSMLEFLSAVSDGVQWDRARYCSIHKPDNWFATEHALEKRGLLRRKCDEERAAVRSSIDWDDPSHYLENNYCELTPAGEAVVQLMRVTGIFVEADAAVTKRMRA